MSLSLVRTGCALLLAAALLPAADFVPASGDWNVAANWTPAHVPSASDPVVIGVGKTVTLADPQSALQAASLTVNGTLDLRSATAPSGAVATSLAVEGDIAIGAGGAILIGGDDVGLAGQLILNGAAPTISGPGSLTFSAGAGSTSSSLTLATGSVVSLTGGLHLTADLLDISQTDYADNVTANTSLITSASGVTVDAVDGAVIQLRNGIELVNGGTLNLGIAAKLIYDGNTFSRFAQAAGGTLAWHVNANGAEAILLPGNVALAGTLNLVHDPSVVLAVGDVATLISGAGSAITSDFTTKTGDVGDFTADLAPTGSPRTYAWTLVLTPQLITWAGPPATIVANSANVALTATVDSGKPITYSVQLQGGGASSSTIVGSALHPGSVAEAIRITASVAAYPGDAPPLSAATMTKDVQILALQNVTITAAIAAVTYTYGDTIALTGSCTSGQPLVWTSSDPAKVSISGSTATVVGVGSGVTITASAPASGTYAAGTATAITGTLAPKAVTATVTAVTRGYGVANPTLAFTTSTLVGSDVVSLLGTAVFGGSGATADATTVPGTYPLTLSFTGTNPRYAVNAVDGLLTVTIGSQTIPFSAFGQLTVGATVDLPTTSSAGLAVGYVSADPAIAAISGTTLTVMTTGSVVITASQAGDAYYAAAPDVTQTAVIKQAQTLTFAALDAQKVGATQPLVASATSGLAVAFTVSDTAVATVSGSTLVAVNPGTITVTASQAGDGTYWSATPVVRTVTITGNTNADTNSSGGSGGGCGAGSGIAILFGMLALCRRRV